MSAPNQTGPRGAPPTEERRPASQGAAHGRRSSHANASTDLESIARKGTAGTAPQWTRDGDNRLDRAWLTVWRALIPPRLRSRLRWAGRERLALWLDRLCGEDTP